MENKSNATLPSFPVINQNGLSSPVKGNVAWCPTMDLIAFAMMDNTVSLYRMNGQRVWTIPQFHMPVNKTFRGERDNVQVEIMTWRPDGEHPVRIGDIVG